MDSFGLRMQLTNLFLSLNSSKQASLDICNFFIRNYVIQEDLYPALLDVLPRLDINRRLNLFQFIDDFLTLIISDSKYKSNDIIYNYAFLIISDMHKILQYILPQSPENTIILDDNHDNSNNNIKEILPKNGIRKSEIRTLANLPFCYSLLCHISEKFKLKKLSHFIKIYNSNLLDDEEIGKVQNGVLFDESAIYSDNIEPTKSSHVDDYMNSSPNLTTGANQSEDNYIPEKIEQGLNSAWEFLIAKRKQSQYERLLIDYQDDPFHSKESEHNEQIISNKSININMNTLETLNSSVKNIDENYTNKTPKKQIPSISTQSPQPKNVLLLSHELILQRIEADRERQKRGKETLWEVEREQGQIKMSEFEFIYDTLQSFDPIADKPIIDEMENLYQLCTFKDKDNNTKVKHQDKKNNYKGNSKNSLRGINAKNKNSLYKSENPAYSGNELFYSNEKNKRQRTNRNANDNNKNVYVDRRSYDEYYGYESEWHYKGAKQNNQKRGGYGYRRKDNR